MNKIPVSLFPISPTFSSWEAAISHARSYPPLAKAKADEWLVNGDEITDGFWSDTDFLIRFSNGQFLHVWVEPHEAAPKVNWQLSDQEPKLAAEVERVGGKCRRA